MAGDWIASAQAVAQMAASSSDGQGVPLWVAGLFALGGAAITLVVQVFSGHNANRREDVWSCFRSLAEFIAAAHSIIRAAAPERLDAAAAEPSCDAAGPPEASCGQPRDSASTEVKEAFTRVDSSYALLVLALPALEERLSEVRTELARFVDGPRETKARDDLRDKLDNLPETVRPQIRFPIVQFFGLKLWRSV